MTTQTHLQRYPNYFPEEHFYISTEGLSRLSAVYDAKDPLKNIEWTVDYKHELPIRVSQTGAPAQPPITII
jgi:long-chain-fatty-acid--CoA ligase ACSBG